MRAKIFRWCGCGLLGMLVVSCGGEHRPSSSQDSAQDDPVQEAAPETPQQPPVPVDMCGDRWDSLEIIGLEGDDTIIVNWNPGWDGYVMAPLGNVYFNAEHFTKCGMRGDDFSGVGFEIVDAGDYDCDIEADKDFFTVRVSCHRDAQVSEDLLSETRS